MCERDGIAVLLEKRGEREREGGEEEWVFWLVGDIIVAEITCGLMYSLIINN